MFDKILVKPMLPTENDWAQLIKLQGEASRSQPKVDVIIPVYKGFEETARCIYSVCHNRQNVSFRVVVIDDKSPQLELVVLLEGLAASGLIELHKNIKNLGFVGTVNYGMNLHKDRDVVLLNSDTEVYSNWLDRIYNFAHSDGAIGTVTPLSNNAEICSYPLFVKDNDFELEIDGSQIDKIASRYNSGCSVDAPTGVGFCMFIKRECLAEVGLFDEETFGRGYGEENDFCQRAIAFGYRNTILVDTYVRHYGSTSFGKDKEKLIKTAVRAVSKKHPNYHSDVQDFIHDDLLLPYRRNIDVERLRLFRSGRLVLFIAHNWGGGTERHVQDLKKHLEQVDSSTVIILRPSAKDKNQLLVDDCRYPNIGPFLIDGDIGEFASFLRRSNVDLVHIHHLIGATNDLSDYLRLACKAATIPYDFTVHDYFLACPRIHLIDHYGDYCGEPDLKSCERCCKSGNYLASIGGTSVWSWRENNVRLLRSARRIWVPNDDVKKRIERYFPDVSADVRAHPDGIFTPVSRTTSSFNVVKKRKKVALVGGIGRHKGSKLLLEVATYAKVNIPDIEFVVIGHCETAIELKGLGNVKITGAYENSELSDLLIREDPNIVWLSSICPETYSYTLSEIMANGYWPVSFDFGAVADRIKRNGFGSLIEIELMFRPDLLAKELMQQCNKNKVGEVIYSPIHYASIIKDYYEL